MLLEVSTTAGGATFICEASVHLTIRACVEHVGTLCALRERLEAAVESGATGVKRSRAEEEAAELLDGGVWRATLPA